jgi:hypothetical protein
VVGKRRELVYWMCQLAGWYVAAAIGLLVVLQREESFAPAWKLAVTFGAGATIAIACTHVYRGWIGRHGWAALSPARLLPRALAASLILGITIPFAAAPFWLLMLGDGTASVRQWAPPAVFQWSWMVFVWGVVYFGFHYFERWRQAELDKLQLAVVAAEARLNGLMSQLNPHFLFNCLNSVRALIVEDPARAQTTVTALSNLMRYSMQAVRIAIVPLETEMEMVRTYLSLEGVRLDERLTTTIEIAPETRSVQIPTMLVQSLVENGVKHGIERLPAGGAIAVASWLEQGTLRVRVTNSGRIVARDDSTRIGLANARERLRLLYGARASLALTDDGRSVVADLSVPVGAGAAG